MSDDLVKLEWRIRGIPDDVTAEAHTQFGFYIVEKIPYSGFQWSYCFDECCDAEDHSCEDIAHGMSLAEEHWRDRVQPITKPLTDRIEELENKLEYAVGELQTMLTIPNSQAAQGILRTFARTTIAELKGEK